MRLPSGLTVSKDTPIYKGSNFTWGEATKNCTRPIRTLVIDGKTIMSSRSIEQKIVEAAKELDKIRRLLGNRPIRVNSWYRDPQTNARVGGTKYSRHQYGDAVDIVSNYWRPSQVREKLETVMTHGGMGTYWNFNHLDWRGHKARWAG